ncbi:MAG: hypothetical protein AB7N71_01465 [Phycisphaerae bacterium]
MTTSQTLVPEAVAQKPAAAGEQRDSAGPAMMDVWTRSARKYRVRAILLLSVNFLLFCGLCAFLHWLHFARAFDFTWESYVEPFQFWGPQRQTLNDFVLFPISVVEKPVHSIVLGFLLASLVSVPIAISQLYRFFAALPFLLAIVVFGHLPWMAITLLGSCVLASVRPFRLRFRYGAALLALIPVLFYLYFASRGDIHMSGSFVSPEQRQLLAAPWVLAVLVAALMLAVILGLARLVAYRPGPITPIISIMFATPVVLFHQYVGADELAYRVLARDVGPKSLRFEPIQSAQADIRALLHRWTEAAADQIDPEGATLSGLWAGNPEAHQAIKRRIASRLYADLLEDRRYAHESCRRFIADYPESRHLPAVLHMQARAMDTRLAEGRLVGDRPVRELYFDFPHVQSEEIWDRLFKQFPESPYAIVAAVRGAQLRARRGEFAEALQKLDAALAHPDALALFRKERDAPTSQPAESPQFDVSPYVNEACELAALIRQNANDPEFGNAPLMALMRLDPLRPEYRTQLQRLIQQYDSAKLRDNLVVDWSIAAHDPVLRLRLLRECVTSFESSDAFPEAAYHLAELEILRFGRDAPEIAAQGLARLRSLDNQFRRTCWGWRSGELLIRVAPLTPEPKPAKGNV